LGANAQKEKKMTMIKISAPCQRWCKNKKLEDVLHEKEENTKLSIWMNGLKIKRIIRGCTKSKGTPSINGVNIKNIEKVLHEK
jgi:hypothetical protein